MLNASCICCEHECLNTFFCATLSSCYIYILDVQHQRDKTQETILELMRLLLYFTRWKSPHCVCACQTAPLYLYQWHTFLGSWCVSISPRCSASIQCSITAGYLKKRWSLQRAVPIFTAITVGGSIPVITQKPSVLCAAAVDLSPRQD